MGEKHVSVKLDLQYNLVRLLNTSEVRRVTSSRSWFVALGPLKIDDVMAHRFLLDFSNSCQPNITCVREKVRNVHFHTDHVSNKVSLLLQNKQYVLRAQLCFQIPDRLQKLVLRKCFFRHHPSTAATAPVATNSSLDPKYLTITGSQQIVHVLAILEDDCTFHFSAEEQTFSLQKVIVFGSSASYVHSSDQVHCTLSCTQRWC